MLFKDNLYSIVKQDIGEDVATFGLRLDADSVIYKAHFPSKPTEPLLRLNVETRGDERLLHDKTRELLALLQPLV